jgi:hypothetical protein
MIQQGGILARTRGEDENEDEWLIVKKRTQRLPVSETTPMWPCEPNFGIFVSQAKNMITN